MTDNKTLKKIVIFSTFLLLIGVFLIIYSRLNNCSYNINRAIETQKIKIPYQGKRNAIYLIKELNIGCRSCAKYDTLRKDAGVYITFYVQKDFSDNDIANFRDAFDIPSQYGVERIGKGWERIYEKCNPSKKRQYNILILVNEKNKVTRLWSF
jgi:hypothetical protein